MDVILHIGIAQFLFAALLIVTKKQKQMADTILTLWLLLMVIFMGLTLLKIEFPNSGWGRLQLFPFFFTVGPFLFVYVRTLGKRAPFLEFLDGVHILPFVIFSVTAVTMDSTVDEHVLSGNSFQPNMLIYSISALISVAVYIFLTIRTLNLHRTNLLDHFSYSSPEISLNWLRGVAVLFTATIVLTLISALLNVATADSTLNPGIFMFLGFTIFAFAVSFFGIRQGAIFAAESMGNAETEANEADAEKKTTTRYERSGLRPELAEKYRLALLDYMETEKPFLRRELTIQDVAADLGIAQHHLTQTINEHLDKNFYTLVNEYRVEEVKQRLKDPKYAHLTVLAIANDAGFNSKSSFNMTFKKYVGMTPSAFRKS